MSEQQEHLGRVTSRIGAAILEFCTEGREFRADGLREFVTTRCGDLKACCKCQGSGWSEIRDVRCPRCGGGGAVIEVTVAPGSSDRVLRDLRKRRKLNYKVLSRRESRYRVIPVEVTQATMEF